MILLLIRKEFKVALPCCIATNLTHSLPTPSCSHILKIKLAMQLNAGEKRIHLYRAEWYGVCTCFKMLGNQATITDTWIQRKLFLYVKHIVDVGFCFSRLEDFLTIFIRPTMTLLHLNSRREILFFPWPYPYLQTLPSLSN